MEITRVDIYPVNSESKLQAFATISLDNELVIKNFKIFDGNKGLFIAFPSEYSEKDDKYYDTVYPLAKETRDYIENSILDAYEEKVGKEDKKEVKSSGGGRAAEKEDDKSWLEIPPEGYDLPFN